MWSLADGPIGPFNLDEYDRGDVLCADSADHMAGTPNENGKRE